MGRQTNWTPEFVGQRPPFAPGNQLSLAHGAYSAHRVAALAAEIEQRHRAMPSWPAYLDEPTYGRAVQMWCRCEAVCELLWAWLTEQDLEAALTETTEQTGSEHANGGRVTRQSTTRRVSSVLDQLRGWESRAAGHRARLGLDPLSRAKLGRDVTATRLDGAELLTRMREAAEAAEKAQGATDDEQ